MRIILFAIMVFATLRATAQTTITGHLIDNEKNNLQKATIRCYTLTTACMPVAPQPTAKASSS